MSPSFLQELARPQPDPGGGSAAAYGARLGLALLEKVACLESRRAVHDPEQTAFWDEKLDALRFLGAALAQLQEDDAQAYRQFSQARSRGARGRELEAAVNAAMAVPRQIMEKCREALELAAQVGERCQNHLVSDLLAAAEFLAAGLRGALHIAAANLGFLPEGSRGARVQELFRLSQQGEEVLNRIKATGSGIPEK
jgi:formiminotetrahydrofolate cyclodeaminase